MSNSHASENEIASELRRLLNLGPDANLAKIAQSVRLHFTKHKIQISFNSIKTNKYEIAKLTEHGVLVLTNGAQQVPVTSKLIRELLDKFLIGHTGLGFVSLEKLLDEEVVNNEFLSAFLLALGPR